MPFDIENITDWFENHDSRSLVGHSGPEGNFREIFCLENFIK